MNSLNILTCVAQMSVAMLLTGLLARVLRDHAPRAAANVGICGLILGLGLIVLSSTGVPRPLQTRLSFAAPQLDSAIDRVSPSSPSVDRHRATASDAPGIGLSWQLIRAWVTHQQPGWADDSHVVRSAAAWLLPGLVSLAVLPILIGIAMTLHLHRHSIEVRHHARLVSSALRLDRPLKFRVSRLVQSPCVTLVGRRTIYLPHGWRAWSDSELQAAVAHEVAHLRGSDPWKRLVAQVATALQPFNPLAIWLVRGVKLSQELAADQEACRAIADYRQSLCRLALRLDTSASDPIDAALTKRLWSSGMVSVSSSHLIRRIEMLMDRKQGQSAQMSTPRWPLVLTLAVFCVCACWTVHADPPEPASSDGSHEPAARVARLSRDSQTSESLFQYAGTEPWSVLGKNDQGYVAINAAELMKHPSFKAWLPIMVDGALAATWSNVAKSEAKGLRDQLGITTDNLQHLAGSVVVKIEKKSKSEQGKLEVSSHGATAVLDRKVDYDRLRNAIDVPKAANAFAGLLGKFGQDQKLGQQDQQQTLSKDELLRRILSETLTDGVVSQRITLTSNSPEPDAQQFARIELGWKAVDGGLATICASVPKTMGFVENEKAEQFEKILAKSACVAVGVDVDATRAMGVVRVATVPRAGVELSQLKKQVASAATFWAEHVPDDIALGDVTLGSSQADGHQDHVVVSLEVPLAFVMSMLRSDDVKVGVQSE